MVTHGWQRAAFRELAPQLKSRWQPVHTFAREQPPASGEVVAVDVALLPQATRFRAGTVVRLELRGDWPYPRNPVTGQFPSGYSPSATGQLTVHSGGGYDSHLLVGARTFTEPRDRAG
jgi:predicted acyl esterase